MTGMASFGACMIAVFCTVTMALGETSPAALWGGAAAVRISCDDADDASVVDSPTALLSSVSMQECTLEGVCQWLGKVETDRKGGCQEAWFPVQRGLAAEWILHLEATFEAATFWDRLIRKSDRTTASQVLLSSRSATCAAPEGCRVELKPGLFLLLQVEYEEPYVAPLLDTNLQLLAINFSAYAVKDFPYSAYVTSLDGECETWPLLAESHDCEKGAHTGVWVGRRSSTNHATSLQDPSASPSHPLVSVIFKGTDFSRLAEVKTDLMMALTDCRLHDAVIGRCATGFLEAYQSIRAGLLEGLTRVAEYLAGEASTAELLIAGHSLGGAMATLFLADLLLHPSLLPFPIRSTTVWTFGSPMLGDAAFSHALASLEAEGSIGTLRLRDHVRVVNTNADGTTDFITHYPLCVPHKLSLGLWGHTPETYQHVGRRQYLSKAGHSPELAPPRAARVPRSRLMAEPGAACLADLLIKGANWLHDERDTYLPWTRSRAPDANSESYGRCSGRSGGKPGMPVCQGVSPTYGALATLVLATVGLVVVICRNTSKVYARTKPHGN